MVLMIVERLMRFRTWPHLLENHVRSSLLACVPADRTAALLPLAYGPISWYHITMTDQTNFPDYQLDEVLALTTVDQLRALSNTTRQQILGLLTQRAATTKQLAEALAQPKGTVSHHLHTLETAGLIRVVRTRQVRAITEKYYGKVARLTRIATGGCLPSEIAAHQAYGIDALLLQQAQAEIKPATDTDDPTMFVLVHARIPASQARRFAHQVEALSQEFCKEEVPGEQMYGFVAGIYATRQPTLPEDVPEHADAHPEEE
jgi:DNA-binding transcriptional ArsR family regulator